mmetsp:Transcript_19132/g.62072  ORF Transcript_19132/g.62072 Transcript_19132/m.62072 type:complete len:212 (+) Transcript_19132:322-957(+)
MVRRDVAAARRLALLCGQGRLADVPRVPSQGQGAAGLQGPRPRPRGTRPRDVQDRHPALAAGPARVDGAAGRRRRADRGQAAGRLQGQGAAPLRVAHAREVCGAALRRAQAARPVGKGGGGRGRAGGRARRGSRHAAPDARRDGVRARRRAPPAEGGAVLADDCGRRRPGGEGPARDVPDAAAAAPAGTARRLARGHPPDGAARPRRAGAS